MKVIHRILTLILAFTAIATAQTKFPLHLNASGHIERNVTVPSGKTLTLSGTLSGTPTGGTLDLSGLTLTLPAAVGDVDGPGSATDNAIAVFSGTTGKLLRAGTPTIDNLGNLTVAGAYLRTTGDIATINTSGSDAEIYTTGESAAMYTNGANAHIYTSGQTANIYTSGADAYIAATGTNGYVQSRTTFKLTNGTHTTTLSHAPTAHRAIVFPDADSKLPIASHHLTFTGPTAARTITLPDANFTAARTDAAQTFTGVQTMTSPVINGNIAGTTSMQVQFSSDTSLRRVAADVLGVYTAAGALGNFDAVGYRVSGNTVFGASGLWFRTSSMHLTAGSSSQIKFTNNVDGPAGTADSGLARDSAGVVRVTDGTTGTGALKVGALIAAPQALSGAGAVNVTTTSTAFTSTGAAEALTLADGVAGQIKTICHVVDGGSGVLTPTTKSGYTTITFTNVGDSVTLQFHTTAGWCITGIYGAVAAP